MKASRKTKKKTTSSSKSSKKHESKHTTKKSSHKKKDTVKEVKLPDPKKQSVKFPWLSLGIVVLLILVIIFLIIKSTSAPTVKGELAQEDKAVVEFYVMSQCPYGTQVENVMAPVLEEMGGAIDFSLNFIVNEVTPGNFQSLHGPNEVTGDIAQLCAMKYSVKPYDYVDMIICQNKDAKNVHTNWEACAEESGLPVEKVRTCLQGEEGKTLLRESMSKAKARQASGSPTIFVEDESYKGARDSVSFKRAICSKLDVEVKAGVEACNSLPVCVADTDCTEEEGKIGVCNNPGKEDASCSYQDPVELEYIVLNSKKCSSCDTTRIVQVSQQLFVGAKARLVDIDSEEGKALVAKHNIEVVPAYIFDSKITETKSWKTVPDLNTAFEKTADSYKLKDEVTKANFFVSEEARTEYYDAIGVTLGDNKPQIDFFVMSFCPYGNQAEQGIAPVYDLLKDYADFNPKYVIYSNYQGGGPNYCFDGDVLCSMHGIQELNQDVREACALKYEGSDSWFKFALAIDDKCTYKNADTCWEDVATGLGLDVEKIKTCEAEEGEALMTADKALGDRLKVSGSPSVFIDGEAFNGGRTPEAYKQALCAAFDEAPAACDTELEGATASGQPAAPAAPAGSC